MPRLADKYPDMKLMIAHLSSEEHVEAVANAKHGNIYVDTSARGSALNHIVEYAVQKVGSEKILFGTDTYACSCSAEKHHLSGRQMVFFGAKSV